MKSATGTDLARFESRRKETKTMETKYCTKCKGQRREDRICPFCMGERLFPKPENAEIFIRLFAQRGRGHGKFRVTPPKRGGLVGKRAYYVWRTARWHGGADNSVPVTAMFLIEGDPYTKELDAMADKMAELVFGSSTAQAERWKGLI